MFKENLLSLTGQGEWILLKCEQNNDLAVVGCRISKWDLEHFGLNMAGIKVFFASPNENGERLKLNLLNECLSLLQEKGIDFVSARIHGDDLLSIHFLENTGFRYYEDIIWPVLRLPSAMMKVPENLRLMTAGDLDTVKLIASHYQYDRGHFHCDERFPKPLVNTLYSKWVESAFNRNGTIAVIESEGKVAGYFVFEMDKTLSKHLGYSYGRLQSLALDSTFRGKGLGKALFEGTLAYIKQSGGEFVDSGYATKNHLSARLHYTTGFLPVYEEITMHCWLK
ncbi:MAG: GNAT family N-acetyltransferase [Bacteroidota bacterium]